LNQLLQIHGCRTYTLNIEKEQKMAEEFGEPITSEEDGKKNRTVLIAVIAVVVVCCCCCAAAAALYYGIEPAMNALGIPVPWY
jgi:type VI protein secretion system component VasF